MSATDTAPRSIAPDAPCPCGSGQTYAACCGPIIARERPAADAEQLMRSRFTAFALENYEHVHRTHLPTFRKPYVPEPVGDSVQWTRLQIHQHTPGPQPDHATVEFTAWFSNGEREGAHHEKAEFKRIDGEWIYTRPLREGPAPVKAAPKVGRNDPCPCGSGKKYKQCCLTAPARPSAAS